MLPTGTITFLFTDVQDSTRTWERCPQIMKSAMARHDEMLEVAIANFDGQIVKKRGDGYHAVFNTPINALRATIEAQRSLQSEPWDEEIGSIYVRMSLHTAATEERQGDYYGSQVNRAARLEAVAHGGQILISMATRELVLDDLRCSPG
jgi:class 3 adenylate cyclase